MHNTCSSSSTFSLRSKGSLSFSFNDYSYFLNERFEQTPLPSSSSSCCACCANSIHRVSINPSFLYGLRQSTLIQWSASRRLILGGGDRYYYRFPISDVDRDCYGVSCSQKERGVNRRRGRRGKGRFGCMVSEEKGKRHHSRAVDDAEAVLSLLTEEVGEECFGVKERNGSSHRRVQVGKRGNVVKDSYRGKQKNVGSGSSESNSKCEFESVAIRSREEDCRRAEDREAFLRCENRRARKEGSSCSSYYSFSSLGDFESDTEVQAKRGGFVEESSSGYKQDSKRSEKGSRFDGEVVEEFKKQGDDAEGHGEVLKRGSTAVGSYKVGSGVECDWRNKSEKKLTEISIEKTQSRKESAQMHSRVSGIHEAGSGKASGSHKHFDDKMENSTLAGNLDEETRKEYGQISNRVIGQSESRRKYQQLTEMPEIHGSDVDTTSRSQKRFIGKKENVAVVNLVQQTRDEHCKKGNHITGQDKLRRNSHQLAETTEIQDIDIRTTSISQMQSERKMKNREENSNLILSSVQDTEEKHHQTGQWMIGQPDSRKNSQWVTEISDMHDSDTENTSTSRRQSEVRLKSREENSTLVFSSTQEAEEQHPQIDREVFRRTESRKGSQDVTTSMVQASDAETAATSQRASEKIMNSQGGYLTSVVKSVEETSEKHSRTDERVMQMGSRKEAQRPTKLSSFHETTSVEASSSQAYSNLVSQARVQQIDREKRDETHSHAIVTPPSSQLVTRGSLHVEPPSGFATNEDSSETSESGSSALHTHPQGRTPALHHELYGGARRGETSGESLNLISHEDVLGSADRLEKSSMHFVGEFVEKVRHEVSTSEIQKEKKFSETKLVYEGEKSMQKGFSQYGSEDSQLKEHDSRLSSGGSGTKGPSDEMWDVKGPSIQEAPKMEAQEGTTTTGNSIARRTSRSLWSIIADVVRMRWGSRAETHSSAVKSSSNESVSSEAWFSGHEPDDNNDENAKRERRSMPQEPTSADQQQLGKFPTQSQGEGSDAMRPEDKIRHVKADASSSSGILESGSASKGISPVSREENLGWSEDGKSIQGTPSSTPVVESSLPLPARHIRRSPVVEEISDTGTTDVSGSGSMDQMEQPVTVRLTEVSGIERKDGELKRRKLQRNKQVPKDRFDEWEEAYKLESEQRKIDEMFMREALLEAKKAADTWEVPVGAVLVQHGKIIARGYNLVEELRDSTAHAEMICIREASNLLQTWRLAETTLYVTLEPCPMCAGAILQARIDTLVWGAPNKLLGADGSWIRLFPNGSGGGNSAELTDKPAPPVHPFHTKMTIRRGVLASESTDVMQQFFQLRRRKKETKPEPPTPPSCLPISNHPSKFLTKMHGIFNIMFCL